MGCNTFRIKGLQLVTVAVSVAAAAAAGTPDWIARERIRAGWLYPGDGVAQIARFRKAGLNALIVSARDPVVFRDWARAARQVDGMHLFGVIGFSFDAEKVGLRRAVFGNGYQSVVACPTDARFWQQAVIEPAVQLARDGLTGEAEISGILIDFELYANSSKGGQIYYTDACYCDHCFSTYLQSRGLTVGIAEIPFAKRVAWLKEKGVFDGYHPYLQQAVREQATAMRTAVEAVRPDFRLGFYPVPHNWMLVGVAQGLGSPGHPMILWSTTTYGGGGAANVPDLWREETTRQGIHAYYCPGLLLRCYSAANLAANLVGSASKANGYWLFTVHTLCTTPDEQKGDYYLAAGTPEEYLGEITRANRELDRAAADAGYRPDLPLVEEPVWYRHTGYDVKRFPAPRLQDRSTAARGTETAVPPLGMIESGFVMTCLTAGERAALRFVTGPGRQGKDSWGVSYAVLDAAKTVVQQGVLPPAAETALEFVAAAPGLHTVVLTPGHYGTCTVTKSTVPFALWAGKPYEVPAPGGTLHFRVPEGLAEFRLAVRCNHGSSGVKVTLCDPTGAVTREQETDPLVRDLELKVPTGNHAGKVWRLRIAKIEGKSYRSVFVELDPRLPPLVTPSPEFMFVPVTE